MDAVLVTNIINSVVAFATLAVAIVAVVGIRENRRLAREDWLHSQQLATEERQHQSRPIVVPVGELSRHMSDGSVDWEYQRQIVPPPPPPDPGTSVQTMEPVTQVLTLQNMGEGIALNIHSVLYGPSASAGVQYVSWNNGPIQGKSSIEIVGSHGGMILDRDTKADGVHVLYDPSEMDYRVARLTTTYHDLFGKRHVSIFDYINMPSKGHRWMHVATTSGIEYDLEELDNQQQPPTAKRKPIK